MKRKQIEQRDVASRVSTDSRRTCSTTCSFTRFLANMPTTCVHFVKSSESRSRDKLTLECVLGARSLRLASHERFDSEHVAWAASRGSKLPGVMPT